MPVVPGEITSQVGWRPGPETERLKPAIERLKKAGIRVSLFVEPDAGALDAVKSVGATNHASSSTLSRSRAPLSGAS